MTEDAGSHGERGHARRSHGGGAGRWATIGGWGVAALLAAYLGYGMLNREHDRPRPPFSEETLSTLLAGLFWALVAVGAAASVLGMLWTMRAYQRREKPSLLSMRNAFAFGIVAAALFAVVPREKGGHWFIAWVAAALVAGQSCMFAYAAFRESRRSHGGGHRSRRGGEDDEDES